MKYIKKYNESAGLDIDFVMAKIREHFSESDVVEMLKKEISEWSDDEDFYSSNGNGEAEEVVIHEMIGWFKKEFSKQLEELDFATLEDEIKSTYESLN